MLYKKALHLRKMNLSSKRGTPINIYFFYMSLVDMINQRGDEYPSNARMDSYNYDNTFPDESEIQKFNKYYNFPFALNLLEHSPESVLATRKTMLFVSIET